MSDFTLQLSDEPQPKLAKEIDPYFCSAHKWAAKESFVEVIIKKTNEAVIRCGFCEREKYENKKMRSQQWQDEKEKITPYYVRRILAMGKHKLRMEDIPEELVEAKQAIVKLKRVTDKMNEPLKTCTQHGKLYREDVIKAGKERSGTHKWRCRQCMRDLHAKHYQLHKAKVLAAHKSYKARHPDKVAQIKKESYAKNNHKYLERSNEYKKIHERKCIRELSDRYIKKQLVKRTNLSMSGLPDSLIQCKRALMQLKRSVRSRTDEIKIQQLEDQLNGKK